MRFPHGCSIASQHVFSAPITCLPYRRGAPRLPRRPSLRRLPKSTLLACFLSDPVISTNSSSSLLRAFRPLFPPYLPRIFSVSDSMRQHAEKLTIQPKRGTGPGLLLAFIRTLHGKRLWKWGSSDAPTGHLMTASGNARGGEHPSFSMFAAVERVCAVWFVRFEKERGRINLLDGRD